MGGKRKQRRTNVFGHMRNEECCGSVLSKEVRTDQEVTSKR